MNDLQYEKSPYLLQHKDNPVQWMSWGEKAFALAKADNKPIFLSIGYSTCHWCHVMAHESFESKVVADALNKAFVCIKVDREERPDVDSVYMAACVAATGSGGWPLTALLTPDQKPFWVGTYLKRNELMNLISIAAHLWENEPEKLLSQSSALADHLSRQQETAPGTPRRSLVEMAANSLNRRCDKVWGGFGHSTKFPMAHNLLFMMRYAKITDDKTGMELAEITLQRMGRGGIFDHVGGGFSRYSTDVKWLAPHFEKMLYDNALLLLAYTEAYQDTGRLWYKTIAEKTAQYVLRELRDPAGGFYCGQDADSEGEEGKYYLFDQSELDTALGSLSIPFCRRFDVTAAGNFHGRNILNLISTDDWETAPNWEQDAMKKLSEYRQKRTRLSTDDKVLTSWNGLMIGALARAGQIMNHTEWIQAAKEAAAFIDQALRTKNGTLQARWRDGDAAHDAKLEDFTFYVWGLLHLYEATFLPNYLRTAAELTDQILENFFDEEHGGCYPYSAKGEQLITRIKDSDDGALPSGNGVTALVLSRLSRITGLSRYSDAADKQLQWLAGAVERYPSAFCVSMLAMLEELWPTEELVVCAKDGVPDELSEYLRTEFRQGLTVLLKTPKTADELAVLAPYTADYPIPESGVMYYRCHGGACERPSPHLT